MRKSGFDSELYMEMQSEQILKRIQTFQGKLYLEFGGKLLDDTHAARVLPGFDPGGKVKLLHRLREQSEVILCLKAADIENAKMRSDIGISYDLDALRLIDRFRALDIEINSVVITQFDGQPAAEKFRKKLEGRGERAFILRPVDGYPADVDTIISENGFGKNPYVPTTKPLVVVTAPGPGSGKLAVCLSQIYHEYKRGVKAGYAKFETFPIWNLPLRHPVNLAYESATADLDDVNMIDPYHLEAYDKKAVNYNRDVEVFPIVRTILSMTGSSEDVYRSPTDMGVNMVGMCITDDEAVREACCQEVLRRFYRAKLGVRLGRLDESAVARISLIMRQLDIVPEQRLVTAPALQKEQKRGAPAVAIQLPDGSFTAGRTTNVMNAGAGAIINAVKKLAGISDRIHLMSPVVLEPIINMKKNNLGLRNPILNVEEVLICLTICAATNPTAEHALSMLPELRHCEAHSSCIIPDCDMKTMRKLGLELTCEPVYPTKDLYYE